MGAIGAVSTALDALRREPVVFLPLLVIAAVSTVLSGLQFVSPALGLVGGVLMLGWYLVVPYVVGGALSLVEGALDGDATTDSFFDGARRYYVRLLAGGLLVVAVTLVAYVLAAVIGFALLFGVFAIGAVGDPGAGGFGVLAVIGIVVVGLLLLVFVGIPLFFLQFYGAAIVLEEHGIVDGFRRSIDVARDRWVSVLGFDGILLALGTVTGVVSLLLYPIDLFSVPAEPGAGATSSSLSPDPLSLGTFLVWSLLSGTLLGGFQYVYYLAFYRSLTGDAAAGPPGGSESPEQPPEAVTANDETDGSGSDTESIGERGDLA
jgi:hypothetical protein